MGIKIVFLILFYLFFGVSPIFAVTVTISNYPSVISDQPFNFDVSVSGAQSGTNYLRANLFLSGTTKYFGYTFNGSNFANSSDYSQYLPITIDPEGTWIGSIQAKLDPDSSYYNGPGTYSLKVRRYTQSGSSYTWSNEVNLSINLPTPTPSPTPSPTPTSTPTPATPYQPLKPSPTPSPSSSFSKTKTTTSTSSPTPKPSLTTSPSSTPTPSPSKNVTKTVVKIASVAGASSSATPSTMTEVKNQKPTSPIFWIGIVLVLMGVGSLGYIYLRKNAKIPI